MTDKIKLSKRVVACKGWRWIDGAAWYTDGRDWPYGRVLNGEFWELDEFNRIDPDGPLPQLDDPATLGGLLALVREAFADPRLFVEYLPDEDSFRIACDFDVRMRVWELSRARLAGFGTEAEALVAALEAAP